MPPRQGPPPPPASAPLVHLRRATGPLRGGTGACRSGLNSANPVSTLRAEAGSPSQPLNASRPQIPKHSPLPFSRRPRWRQPEPGPHPTASERLPPRDAVPSPLQTVWPPHNTAARRTQSPPPRTGGAHGRGVGCAQRPPGTRGQAHLSGTPRPPECTSSAGSPPRSRRRRSVTLTRPPPQPTPPRAQPLPCAPLLSPSAGSFPPGPPPQNPPTPPPSNRSSTAGGRRGAAAGGPETARSRGSGPDSVPGREARRRPAVGLGE